MTQDKPAVSSLEEINAMIPWNMTPGCDEAKRRLQVLITNKEETIPVSKIKARIKDLEQIANNTKSYLYNVTGYELTGYRINELENLLKPQKEDKSK